MLRTLSKPRGRSLAAILLAGAALAACATPEPRLATRLGGDHARGAAPSGEGGRYKVGAPYQVAGVWYVPKEQPDYDERGVASWYGDDFHMKKTANGETFDMNAISAAHTTLPLPSIVEVTNLDNGRKIQVRVNDRGPFVGGRLIDLSHAAARELGYDRRGLANVRVRYVGPAPLGGNDVRYAATTSTPAAPPTQPAYVAPAALPPPQAAPAQAVQPNPFWSGAQTGALQPGTLQASAAAPAASSPGASGIYRVQAGAFSDQANAQRAVSQLGQAGLATIEPIQRDGTTLYRVVLQSSADEAEAWALRDRVAAYGFGQARVLRPN